MSTTLSVNIDFPIGTYAFVLSSHRDVKRVKIVKIGATWQDDKCQVLYGVEAHRGPVYMPEDLFLTADAVFAAKDAADAVFAAKNAAEDDEDSED